MSLTIGSMFSGYGGLDLAVEAAFNATTSWHCEWEDAPSKVLATHWPDVPNYRDVTAVDWSSVPPVDIITGGFPCQDVSLAGRRAGMTEGTRSNLWGAMRTAIETIQPRYVVAENVRGLLSAKAASDSDMEPGPGSVGDDGRPNLRALGRVLGDLDAVGYDAQWCGLRAADVGAPHGRFRIFILATHHDAPPIAHSGGKVGEQWTGLCADESGGLGWGRSDDGAAQADWGEYAPAVRRWEQVRGPAPAPVELTPRGKSRLSAQFVEWMMGLPAGWVTGAGIDRSEQLTALGNGVVPQQAYAALVDMLSR